ncbi:MULTISPECIES: LysR family transcriptional regulator [Ramlibacter]|uniref:LysR family transcriptional regulator n=1 Tax=Ramlibacter pinisoli TaxID=2682844 RepID=A0A6N8IZQ5_9BURK|nr:MULTISPECIES: LysR family transcriptional regulator [Ramlibacter]MBA2962099.1 LysR family transcriptional regulator [Ramlibacter sp. CGMCC 1.13660]MVQ32042.1 LysR family transcriptional regulator [Ramlibacter pinisoli]
MDRFQEMRVFAGVVEAGSFVAAADALDMSKAAVSRHVAELESRLGVRLLHRTTRRLSLTGEGEVFFARCRELLQGVDEAESEITQHSGEAVGVLKVSAPVSFGLLRLAPLWGSFLDAHPQIKLDLSLSDRLVDLVEEGIDMAVRIGRLASSSLVSRQLASTRLVLCASPPYLRRHGKLRHPADLAGHAVLAYSLLAMGDTWEFEGTEGPVTVKVQPRMHTNSGDTCRAVALAHQGIILQPSFLVDDDLRSGRLVEVLPDYRSVELGIHAVFPSRKHLLPKVRLLIEHLARGLAAHDPAGLR